MHSNKRLMPSPGIRVNQAHSPGKEGWKCGVGEGSHGSTGGLQEQEKDWEDSGEQIEASGNLALIRFMCRFSEMEAGDGSGVTFAQIILELPSQATPEILAFHPATP